MWHSEDVDICCIYGKVARFSELAPAAVDVQPGPKFQVNFLRIVALLFGSEYEAFAKRAVDRLVWMPEPDASTNKPEFDSVAQSALNMIRGRLVDDEGKARKHMPDLYGIVAPASTRGSPIYFLAVGTGLRLPKAAFRGTIRVQP